ncbi:hypothetical protein [Spiroplasma endosymbiont of Tricholauxania praeusta]|uniref:hypothetical protein n=1 Tax=Spiroplasma endosymbiont of Tricholauxania praeusta TaxID=3066296 RepID=UPI0030CF7432
MQMKNLLRLMGALALTTVATTSVVACGDQTVVNLDTVLKKKELGPISVVDITKPTEKELKEAIKAVPENKNMSISSENFPKYLSKKLNYFGKFKLFQ